MRRNRRGGGSGQEFGGSGEDSFVAVVVTKLTGALLFILLLTMVIMALLPKAVDLAPPGKDGRSGCPEPPAPLAIHDAGNASRGDRRPTLFAGPGGHGRAWTASLDGRGVLPEGLSFDSATGVLDGTPRKGTAQPLTLALRVSDGSAVATRPTRLLVYQSDIPLTTPAWWKPALPPVPWRAWLDQGVGFLVLWLVHLVGMSSSCQPGERRGAALGRARRRQVGFLVVHRRFGTYRILLRLSTLSAMLALASWLWTAH